MDLVVAPEKDRTVVSGLSSLVLIPFRMELPINKVLCLMFLLTFG